MAVAWFRALTVKPLEYSIQYHGDQKLDELRAFWAEILAIDGSIITLLRKSNSGRLARRTWRSAHGVMSVRVHDTLLRARLQAWIDRIRQDWGLDSTATLRGVAQPGSAYRLGR
jgi:hypothetical protein